jgi:hypothetical protein
MCGWERVLLRPGLGIEKRDSVFGFSGFGSGELNAVKNYKELEVWQLAKQFAIDLHKAENRTQNPGNRNSDARRTPNCNPND